MGTVSLLSITHYNKGVMSLCESDYIFIFVLCVVVVFFNNDPVIVGTVFLFTTTPSITH